MGKPKIKLRNLLLALKDQGPFLRFFKNFFISENSRGLFHIRSHQRDNGRKKVKYNTKKTAKKVTAKMEKNIIAILVIINAFFAMDIILEKINKNNNLD